jgi:hypothetical protein
MTFDDWWERQNINAGTGALNNALREIAHRGWQAAVEECAKVCEFEADRWRDDAGLDPMGMICAAAIRALK